MAQSHFAAKIPGADLQSIHTNDKPKAEENMSEAEMKVLINQALGKPIADLLARTNDLVLKTEALSARFDKLQEGIGGDAGQGQPPATGVTANHWGAAWNGANTPQDTLPD